MDCFRYLLGSIVLSLALAPTKQLYAADSVTITVTKGFGISLYASELGDVKQMALGDKGTLFVGSRKKGTLYGLVDSNNDGKVDKQYLIAKGLNSPESVAFKDGHLYVTEDDRIVRFSDIESRLRRPGRAREVFSNLPDLGKKKYTRSIRFGTDGLLYLAIGSPCNVCEADMPYSSILAIDIETGASEQIAAGVRKVIGFDWSPKDGKLWFADLGRNWMGDNIPPDEINRLDTAGSHFGFPYVHAKSINEPAYSKPENLNVVAPVFELPAHVGPTSVHFYAGDQFPERYQGQMFIAENGSWNRSSKVGYQVVMLAEQEDGSLKRETVASFLDGGFPVARPYDLVTAPDGSMYISDDLKGNIYRLYYKNLETSQD
ncbi:PQQ-dependent sugar dehydrogenase [Shewanella maritima]|uniref:PQQ-dependent sugar dehydrogenase n=1 Tax=Shewanella maritima TaxID=2520507 RepID=UPI00373657DC